MCSEIRCSVSQKVPPLLSLFLFLCCCSSGELMITTTAVTSGGSSINIFDLNLLLACEVNSQMANNRNSSIEKHNKK